MRLSPDWTNTKRKTSKIRNFHSNKWKKFPVLDKNKLSNYYHHYPDNHFNNEIWTKWINEGVNQWQEDSTTWVTWLLERQLNQGVLFEIKWKMKLLDWVKLLFQVPYRQSIQHKYSWIRTHLCHKPIIRSIMIKHQLITWNTEKYRLIRHRSTVFPLFFREKIFQWTSLQEHE